MVAIGRRVYPSCLYYGLEHNEYAYSQVDLLGIIRLVYEHAADCLLM